MIIDVNISSIMSANIPPMGRCTPPPSMTFQKLSQKEVDALVSRLYTPKKRAEQESLTPNKETNNNNTSTKARSLNKNNIERDHQTRSWRLSSTPSRIRRSFEKTEEWDLPLSCPDYSSAAGKSHFKFWHYQLMEQYRASKDRLGLEKMIHQNELVTETPNLCPGTQKIAERIRCKGGGEASISVFSRLSSRESATVASRASSFHFNRQPGSFSYSPRLAPNSERLTRQSSRKAHSYIHGHYTSLVNSKDDMEIHYMRQFSFRPKILPLSKKMVESNGVSFAQRLDSSIKKYHKTPIKNKESDGPGTYTGPIIRAPVELSKTIQGPNIYLSKEDRGLFPPQNT